MKRWSSLRRTGAPIPVAPMTTSSVGTACLCALSGGLAVSLLHRLGAGRNRLDDVVVAGATAEITFELVPNGGIVEIVALAVNHVDRSHDHAGRAIAALQPVVLAERLLHGMQRPVRISEALDGQNVRALDL